MDTGERDDVFYGRRREKKLKIAAEWRIAAVEKLPLNLNMQIYGQVTHTLL